MQEVRGFEGCQLGEEMKESWESVKAGKSILKKVVWEKRIKTSLGVLHWKARKERGEDLESRAHCVLAPVYGLG